MVLEFIIIIIIYLFISLVSYLVILSELFISIAMIKSLLFR